MCGNQEWFKEMEEQERIRQEQEKRKQDEEKAAAKRPSDMLKDLRDLLDKSIKPKKNVFA